MMAKEANFLYKAVGMLGILESHLSPASHTA